jgi:NADH-quinone oxidoreductase subunit J
MVITQVNAVHALLYLVVSFLALAAVFFALGAPFAAALEVIVYAGAIMVLFVFVVMMLNVGVSANERERGWLAPRGWIGPAILAGILLGEFVYVFFTGGGDAVAGGAVDPQQVGAALFGPYVLGVELASFLLLAGLAGAYHLGRRDPDTNRAGDRP